MSNLPISACSISGIFTLRGCKTQGGGKSEAVCTERTQVGGAQGLVTCPLLSTATLPFHLFSTVDMNSRLGLWTWHMSYKANGYYTLSMAQQFSYSDAWNIEWHVLKLNQC